MTSKLKDFLEAAREVTRGGPAYFIWLASLVGIISVGVWHYVL